MDEITVTWTHAFRIWWSWLWRSLVWTIPVSVVCGVAVGIAMAMNDVPLEPYALYLQSMGLIIGVYFSVLAMKKVLGKRFNGYRIALIKNAEIPDEEQTEQPTQS